ncbi:MAG: 1-acyl-sn-glycerol-3-phosphate acyltransferase [Chloroflexota bacterium]|nr:1-acyl-sn-glycerol-3-phosphate acyltransferase [Chloroflexota bacterium]
MSAVATGLATLARLTSGASVRWVESHPDPGQRIYFANHVSHLDFVVLWSVLPQDLRVRTRPVAAKDYWDAGPLRRYVATHVFRAVLVDREGSSLGQVRAQLAQLITALDTGASLILFPEGTRGTGEAIGPFKSGLYFLARQRPEIDLIPVHLHNLHRIMPKGEFLPVPQLSCVSFGPPLRLHDGEPKDAFLARAREAVERLRPA